MHTKSEYLSEHMISLLNRYDICWIYGMACIPHILVHIHHAWYQSALVDMSYLTQKNYRIYCKDQILYHVSKKQH